MKALRYALLAFALFSVPGVRGDTLVFAAASLADVLDTSVSEYEQESSKRVKVSYAASSVLAKQIEAGSPGQIFISADADWMNYLKKRGFIAGEPFVLAGNRLVLIAPAGSSVNIRIGKGMNLADLLGGERLATGDPSSVPVGKYARAALEYFGEWDAIESRILPLDSVRVALVVVEENEAPLGIVYLTDAKSSDRVRIVGTFPEESHAPIVYPAGIVRGQEKDPEVQAFYDYLRSPEAAALLEENGFLLPRQE